MLVCVCVCLENWEARRHSNSSASPELFSNAYCHDNHVFINPGSECNTDGAGNKIELPSALFSLRDFVFSFILESHPHI